MQFPAGQDSLFYIASVYPAAKWEPNINKAVLRACALYVAICSGISPGGFKWFPCVQCLLGEEGRVSASGGYNTINRIPLPLTATCARVPITYSMYPHLFGAIDPQRF